MKTHRPLSHLATFVFCVLSFAWPVSASADRADDDPRGSILSQARAAPAVALAQGYLFHKQMLATMLPAAEAGVTIHLPNATISKDNVSEHRRRSEQRLSIYADAIEEKGYFDVSGEYSAKTTESCGRINSTWVSLVHEGTASKIKILQDKFEAQVVIDITHQGQNLSVENDAILVESQMFLQDSMNPDYKFSGTIDESTILIRPMASVLRSWPQWAGPPKQTDIQNCAITLQQL